MCTEEPAEVCQFCRTQSHRVRLFNRVDVNIDQGPVYSPRITGKCLAYRPENTTFHVGPIVSWLQFALNVNAWITRHASEKTPYDIDRSK